MNENFSLFRTLSFINFQRVNIENWIKTNARPLEPWQTVTVKYQFIYNRNFVNKPLDQFIAHIFTLPLVPFTKYSEELEIGDHQIFLKYTHCASNLDAKGAKRSMKMLASNICMTFCCTWTVGCQISVHYYIYME